MNKFLMPIGLVGSICTALVGQSDLLKDPLKHYVAIVGIICTAIIGYLMTPPRDIGSRERVSDVKLQELNK